MLVARTLPGPLGYLATFGRLELRRALRNRRYLLFGIGFPVAFYLLYTGVLQRGRDAAATTIGGTPWTSYFMVSMAAYGAIGAGLVAAQAIAVERSQGWVRLLRVTPLPPSAYVLTKLLVSLAVTVPAVALVALAGVLVNHVALEPAVLLGVVALLVAGSLPFAALGILLGYLFDATSVQGAAAITSIGLAVLGGLWAPVASFPDNLATIAKVLPSYRFADLGWTAIAGRMPDPADVVVLAVDVLVIGALIAWRFRVDEQRARG